MPKESAKSKLARLVPVEEVETTKPKKTLTQIISKLNAKYPASAKVVLGKDVKDIEVIPSGVIGLDYLLGIGGFPRGRMGMISGPYSSWKSTICLRTIAETQKRGGIAAYIDAERSFDAPWAIKHGIDMEQIIVDKPDTEEEALDKITYYINEGIDIIVLDSLVALAPRKEMYSDDKGKEIESVKKEAMGVFARKMSQWCRNNIGRIAKNNTLFIIINQLRDNISGYGNPTSVPGGNAVKFYSSFMIEARKVTGKEGDIIINGQVEGSNYSLKVSKLKVARYGGETTFAAYGSILDNYTSLLDIAIQKKIFEMPNNKTYIFGDKKFIGRENTRMALINDKELYDAIHSEVFKTANVSTFDPFAKRERAKQIDEDAEVPELTDAQQAALDSIEPETEE